MAEKMTSQGLVVGMIPDVSQQAPEPEMEQSPEAEKPPRKPRKPKG